jgi:MoxR-like ATPase
LVKVQLDQLRHGFDRMNYIIKDESLFNIYLALKLEKPLLVCGPAGVGKTELAKVLSAILEARLIRLQCHEGLDESKALYDWNIQRQLIKIHLDAQKESECQGEDELFSLPYVLQRPLLQAITAKDLVLLLIDEVDQSDRNFEAFLLEVLSDFQVSIPEIGTIKADRKPVVVITNSGERELSEALRRRCVFLYLDFPGIEEEASIFRSRIPDVLDAINEDIAFSVAKVRDQRHQLGSEGIVTLDWARTILLWNADRYQKDYVDKTLEILTRNRDNILACEAYLRQTGSFIESTAGKMTGDREVRS